MSEKNRKNQDKRIYQAFLAAFPNTVPILAGFIFLGAAYGIYMNTAGFSPLYPIFMSATIFAGSMEFIAVGLLREAFNPLYTLALTLMVNARHLFYGISMLDHYKDTGKKKPYLIFGMCDESFSINCTTPIPPGIDKGWFMFFVTLLNHFYWVCGATMGAVMGSFVSFNTKGLEFVMTALFAVILTEQWLKEKHHHSLLIGLGFSLLCLMVFGGQSFILPAMASILLCLTILRRRLAPHNSKGEESL